MKKSEDHFDFAIKSQLQHREVEPSRDLWSEISARRTPVHPKSKVNTWLAVACIIIFGGLFIIFYSETVSKPSGISAGMVAVPSLPKKTADRNSENNNQWTAIPSTRTLMDEKKRSHNIQPFHLPKTANTAAPHSEQKEIVQYKKPENADAFSTKALVLADSADIPKIKKKYADASILLFSVEHRDVINKTKDGSNVATIDLNR